MFAELLAELPLIAILRGLRPSEAEAVGEALFATGFRIIEVPLNSPQPFASIELLAKRFAGHVLIGAGTVMDAAAVDRVHNAGGRLIVTPHFDPYVVTAARLRGMICLPGVATPSEGFAALREDADGLKLFPAELLTPPVVKAWRAVFPPATPMLPVGGITPDNLVDYWAAGVSGFGLGSALFKPGDTLADTQAKAERFVAAINGVRAA